MSNDRKNRTEWVFNDDGPGRQPSAPGPAGLGGSGSGSGLPPLGGAAAAPPHAPDPAPAPALDDRTQAYRPDDGARTQLDLPEQFGEESFERHIDPVVGWLVVIEGPGRGESVTIGAGMNAIGRDPGERVALAFGDDRISAHSHARLIYEVESRSFFISHDRGDNLTRLNGMVVSGPQQLQAGDVIEFSTKTKVVFVPFCGPEFCWSAMETHADKGA